MLTELNCIYDSRKSFYKKVKKEIDGNKTKLYSYETLVVTLDTHNKILILHNGSTESQTTLRHVREFLLQNSISPINLDLKDLSKKSLESIVNKEIKF